MLPLPCDAVVVVPVEVYQTPRVKIYSSISSQIPICVWYRYFLLPVLLKDTKAILADAKVESRYHNINKSPVGVTQAYMPYHAVLTCC